MERKFESYLEHAPAVPEPLVDELLTTAHSRLIPALNRIRRPVARVASIDSSIGRLLAAESPHGLLALSFVDFTSPDEVLSAVRRRFDVVEDTRLAAALGGEIERLLAGDAEAIGNRAVDLSLVESDFQRRVLVRLRKVPAGSVVSYQGLATAVGAPAAQRAVGNTVASNPVPIYVPCHRVIRSNGSLGNYGGGVERKLQLLRAEGFGVDKTRRMPPETVYGHQRSRIFCKPACGTVQRADPGRFLIFANPERARRYGMRPCKLCRPL
jgi:methylated-DNA-[protein]-cysteine S-methyltransferase